MQILISPFNISIRETIFSYWTVHSLNNKFTPVRVIIITEQKHQFLKHQSTI